MAGAWGLGGGQTQFNACDCSRVEIIEPEGRFHSQAPTKNCTAAKLKNLRRMEWRAPHNLHKETYISKVLLRPTYCLKKKEKVVKFKFALGLHRSPSGRKKKERGKKKCFYFLCPVRKDLLTTSLRSSSTYNDSQASFHVALCN